jgi:hypothetical protein
MTAQCRVCDGQELRSRRPLVDIPGRTATNRDSVFHPQPATAGVHILAASPIKVLSCLGPERRSHEYFKEAR